MPPTMFFVASNRSEEMILTSTGKRTSPIASVIATLSSWRFSAVGSTIKMSISLSFVIWPVAADPNRMILSGFATASTRRTTSFSTSSSTPIRFNDRPRRVEFEHCPIWGPAISHPGARRRVKSLWERDFCVKCDEAHCGARVFGSLGTRVPDSRASPDHFWDGGKRRTLGFPQEDQSIGTGWRRRRPGARHRRSTGIGAAGEKAVGKLPRHVAKTWWNAAAMAADLTVVEDHRQRVGKDTDHGQHDEGTVLMGGGLLQVTIRGDGLKGLHVDRPAAASELVDEIRRNGAKIHVRRIEVGADHGSGLFGFCPRALGLRTLGICTLRFFRFRLFDLGHLDWTLLDLDGLGVLHPNRLDDAHDPVGHGPVHLRQVPEL